MNLMCGEITRVTVTCPMKNMSESLTEKLKEQEECMEAKFWEFMNREREYEHCSSSGFTHQDYGESPQSNASVHEEEVGIPSHYENISESGSESESNSDNDIVNEERNNNVFDDVNDSDDTVILQNNEPDYSLEFSEDNSNVLEEILSRDYEVAVPKKSLPPVSEKLAKNINRWLHDPPSRENSRELFAKCLLNENVDGLKPVKINEILYQKNALQCKGE